MAKGPGRQGGGKPKDPAHKLLADNRFARHQYEILETLETGIELLGTEVKSIRSGQVNLRDGFCLIRNGEMQLHNVHISPHSHAGPRPVCRAKRSVSSPCRMDISSSCSRRGKLTSGFRPHGSICSSLMNTGVPVRLVVSQARSW